MSPPDFQTLQQPWLVNNQLNSLSNSTQSLRHITVTNVTCHMVASSSCGFFKIARNHAVECSEAWKLFLLWRYPNKQTNKQTRYKYTSLIWRREHQLIIAAHNYQKCHMSHGCVKFLRWILQDDKTRHTVQCSEAWGRVRRRARPPSMQGNSSLRLSSFCSSRRSAVCSRQSALSCTKLVWFPEFQTAVSVPFKARMKTSLSLLAARVSSSSSWQVLPASVN